jgi:hypothetical protein
MKAKGSQFTQLPMFMPAGRLVDPAHVDLPEKSEYEEFEGTVPMNGGVSFEDKKLSEAMEPGTEDDTYYANSPSGKSLRDSIKESGVRHPVSMSLEPDWDDIEGTGPYRMTLFDGHHRAYAAKSIDPSMEVPVTFQDNLGVARLESGGLDFTRNVDQEDPWERS